ncbi:hypothetical protein K469DRAFT_690756 [Zopfia rhizophila CBS 207.26]|uniref:Uncharacterized protein n=1 Tax=Zopfia rhizophila CBS 207.26 TaxID=1314779 RepID=A0A6A6DWC2_9PEZI|nr:hypothetical protein K469DRAFT_690756 [Zopfia rhizophila CBS 207.26]
MNAKEKDFNMNDTDMLSDAEILCDDEDESVGGKAPPLGPRPTNNFSNMRSAFKTELETKESAGVKQKRTLATTNLNSQFTGLSVRGAGKIQKTTKPESSRAKPVRARLAEFLFVLSCEEVFWSQFEVLKKERKEKKEKAEQHLKALKDTIISLENGISKLEGYMNEM